MRRHRISELVTLGGVAALLACLSGCSSDDEGGEKTLGAPPRYPVPGCESIDHAPCDVRVSGCQRRLLDLSACLRTDEAGELPPVTVMTEAEYVADVNARMASREPRPDPDHSENALVLLGFVEAGAFTPRPWTADDIEYLGGIYRWDGDDIVIIDHGPESDAESFSAFLVHEFIHALQDRDVDLEAYASEHGTSYDAFFAANAVTEGEARFHETRYRASLLGLDPAEVDWTAAFQGTLELHESWLFEQPSPYFASFGVFPYAWGARFVHFTWRERGLSGQLARFAAPPETTHRLMAGVDGALEEDIEPTRPEEPPAPHTWTLQATDVLGAWGVFLFAAISATNLDQARSLALDWRGDGLFVYASESGSTAVVWRIEVSDETRAASLATLARGGLGEGTVEAQATSVVIALTNGTEAIDWAFEP
jgi:hypothetical protein